MIGHQLHHQRRDIFGERMAQRRVVGDMDLAHAGDLRRSFGDAADAFAGHQQMDFAQLGGGGDGGEGGVLDRAAFMFNPDKRLHAATPMDLSLATSSSTSATLTPAERLAGSATETVSSRGAMSTPKSAGVFVASGLDFAFMMLGSDA